MHACYDSLDYEEISHASCYMTGKLIRTLGLLNSFAYLNNIRKKIIQCQIVLFQPGSLRQKKSGKGLRMG